MIARSLLALATCAWLAAVPVSAETFEDMPAADNSSAAANGLVETLGQRLNISDDQAIGGAGALLGLAMNRLSEGDSSRLQQRLPGLGALSSGSANGANGGLAGLSGLGGLIGGAGQLLGGINSLQDVDQIFSVLGMNQGMVNQFAGVMLDYLVKQGLDNSLLGTLGKLWGNPAGALSPLLPATPITPTTPAASSVHAGKAV
ncbi:DUF2780 domain-containing protein [Pseudomonas panipatensis]|uniref:DUF2780 domain-containing protein n=1 Tax=Pseudomonas panipatensis TaxID=428992 RepID=UPI0035B1B315